MNLDIKLLLNHKKRVEYLTIDIGDNNGINIINNEIYDEELLKSFIRKHFGFKNNIEIYLISTYSFDNYKKLLTPSMFDGHVEIIINSEDEYKFYHRQKTINKLL